MMNDLIINYKLFDTSAEFTSATAYMSRNVWIIDAEWFYWRVLRFLVKNGVRLPKMGTKTVMIDGCLLYDYRKRISPRSLSVRCHDLNIFIPKANKRISTLPAVSTSHTVKPSNSGREGAAMFPSLHYPSNTRSGVSVTRGLYRSLSSIADSTLESPSSRRRPRCFLTMGSLFSSL